MGTFLEVCGMALVVVGVTFVFWPAGLIVAGVFMVYIGFMQGEP